MQSSRIAVFYKKPKVILTKKFSFFDQLNVGDRGQLSVDLDTKAINLEKDEEGNDMRIVTFLIEKAEIINSKSLRS